MVEETRYERRSVRRWWAVNMRVGMMLEKY
jgi:hypothetical protein